MTTPYWRPRGGMNRTGKAKTRPRRPYNRLSFPLVMPKVVHAACSHDCPDSCGVLITVDDLGRATRLRGDPNHPVTRGFLCAKVAKYLNRVYSPDRVLYPMRRTAPKGRGVRSADDVAKLFERISWDQAYDEIASRFQAISQDRK